MKKIEKEPDSWLRRNPYVIVVPVESIAIILFFDLLLFSSLSRIESFSKFWLLSALGFLSLIGWYFLKRAIDKDTAFWEILKFKFYQRGIKNKKWSGI